MLASVSQDEPVNCHQCAHYYTTWERKFPMGCRKFGFKGKQVPSMEVLASTGQSCPFFLPKADSVEAEGPEAQRDGSTFSSLG